MNSHLLDITAMDATQQSINQVADAVGTVLLDKKHQIRLAIACVLARGHLLIEDAPGMGKTLFAQTLAKTLGLDFKRVQFTSDLLPADVMGVSIYQREQGHFIFHAGPVFTQMLLVDEVNRASPKTQSALLEAMEERQVTVDGIAQPLPAPFFVMATQNSQEDHGTFPLPEAQLDRFMMRISLGYPSKAAVVDILSGVDRREVSRALKPVLAVENVLALQQKVDVVQVAEPIVTYLYALLEETLNSNSYRRGLSVRALQACLKAARAWALLEGRDFVIPADVQAIFPAVVGHRLQSESADKSLDIGRALLARVAVPT